MRRSWFRSRSGPSCDTADEPLDSLSQRAAIFKVPAVVVKPLEPIHETNDRTGLVQHGNQLLLLPRERMHLAVGLQTGGAQGRIVFDHAPEEAGQIDGHVVDLDTAEVND